MARGKLDQIDFLASPLFFLGILVERGWLGASDWPILGDLSQTFVSIGGTDISIAIALALAGFAIVVATNDWSFDNGLSDAGIQGWAVVATLGLIIAPPFAPVVSDFVNSDVGALVSITVQSTGYAVVSWLG